MSMTSSLIDKLSKTADEWNSSNMFEPARMCREAADTIWELRDDLQRANTENARLRELVRNLYYLSDTYIEEREPFWWKPYEQRMRELGIEVGE